MEYSYEDLKANGVTAYHQMVESFRFQWTIVMIKGIKTDRTGTKLTVYMPTRHLNFD
jgi:hypothetical protein